MHITKKIIKFALESKSCESSLESQLRKSIIYLIKMTKAEIVAEIARSTGLERTAVLEVVEKFMEVIKENMANGENVYLRGFGTFAIKERAEKLARNITKNTSVVIPPTRFRPSSPPPPLRKRLQSSNHFPFLPATGRGTCQGSRGLRVYRQYRFLTDCSVSSPRDRYLNPESRIPNSVMWTLPYDLVY